ncbi:glycerophosphodiester phosphodiesterase [Nakamurella sp. GG22]
MQPYVIGHRGASATVPENTLPAFVTAWEAGARWVEADTQPAADDVPVILHDPTLDRTTTGSGPVRGHTAAQVAELDVVGLPGGRVPTLAALLELVSGDRAVLLEIKGRHTAAQLSAVLTAVRAAGCADRVFLQSFDIDVLRELVKLAPATPFGLLVERLDDDPVGRCRELGAVAYNPHYSAVIDRPEVVPELHAAGISVAVWTADDPDDWARLSAAGVDAVITNTPAEFLRWQAGLTAYPRVD